MVLTRKKEELTKESILKHVSETDIVQAFWPAGKKLEYNTGIISPFRGEKDESFIIGNKFGPITYKDLGELQYRGDVWNFVKQIEGLRDFKQVLRLIDQRFNLGYSTGSPITGKSDVITWEQPKMVHRPPPIIQVTVRKWQKDELQWWNQYGQDISDLKREEIYVPASIYRNRRMIAVEPMTFCYYFPEIKKWKLYRPLAEKGKKVPIYKRKWDNSMTDLTYIEGLSNLTNSELGVVAKSRKDLMVLKKALGIGSVCSLQAEDPSALKEEDMKFIEKNCSRRLAVMDNDKKGKEMSYWLTDRGYLHANVPDKYLEEHKWSDFADMAKGLGIDAVTEYFRSKKLIV